MSELEKDKPCTMTDDGVHDWADPEPDTGLVICRMCGARYHAREQEVLDAVKKIAVEEETLKADVILAGEDHVMPAKEAKKSLNYNEGKLGPALVLHDMRDAFMEVVKAVEYGAEKYCRGNWALSINTEDHDAFLKANEESMWRHEFTDEFRDEESGLPHTAHRIARLMQQLCYELRDERNES